MHPTGIPPPRKIGSGAKSRAVQGRMTDAVLWWSGEGRYSAGGSTGGSAGGSTGLQSALQWL